MYREMCLSKQGLNAECDHKQCSFWSRFPAAASKNMGNYTNGLDPSVCPSWLQYTNIDGNVVSASTPGAVTSASNGGTITFTNSEGELVPPGTPGSEHLIQSAANPQEACGSGRAKSPKADRCASGSYKWLSESGRITAEQIPLSVPVCKLHAPNKNRRPGLPPKPSPVGSDAQSSEEEPCMSATDNTPTCAVELEWLKPPPTGQAQGPPHWGGHFGQGDSLVVRGEAGTARTESVPGQPQVGDTTTFDLANPFLHCPSDDKPCCPGYVCAGPLAGVAPGQLAAGMQCLEEGPVLDSKMEAGEYVSFDVMPRDWVVVPLLSELHRTGMREVSGPNEAATMAFAMLLKTSKRLSVPWTEELIMWAIQTMATAAARVSCHMDKVIKAVKQTAAMVSLVPVSLLPADAEYPAMSAPLAATLISKPAFDTKMVADIIAQQCEFILPKPGPGMARRLSASPSPSPRPRNTQRSLEGQLAQAAEVEMLTAFGESQEVEPVKA